MKLRPVPAATGLQWVHQGIRTFFRQPLALSGLFLMFMALVSLLAMLPVVGAAFATVMTPAINLGLMSAAREAEAGRFPMPSQLVTAFRGGQDKARGVMALGGIYGMALLAVLLLAGLTDSGADVPVDMSSEEALRGALSSPALWIVMVAMMPLQMLFWHAPALLFWHGVPPVKSLFFSFMACWTNKGALTMFLLGWTGLFVAMSLALSLVATLLGGTQFVGTLTYPAVLLMASMFFTSVWFSYKDSFDDGEATAETVSPDA